MASHGAIGELELTYGGPSVGSDRGAGLERSRALMYCFALAFRPRNQLRDALIHEVTRCRRHSIDVSSKMCIVAN